ncbi:MAG: hypothetical protein EBR86_06760 [Planctomycetia bacterium]|nr:hypothetical protein [Planctomycetia bacterium]
MTNPDTSGSDESISRFIDGAWSVEAAASLQVLLSASATSREAFVEQMLLDSLLAEELGPEALGMCVDSVGAGLVEPTDGAAAVPAAGESRPPRARSTDRAWSPWWLRVGWVAIATGVAGVWLGLGQPGLTAGASASVVIDAAAGVHAEKLAREYVVEIERAGDRGSSMPPRDVRVTTQGDRFFVTMSRGARQWFWGRDAAGAIWITVGPRRAVVVDDDEVGLPLQSFSDLYSLEIETLLRTFRTHGRVERFEREGGSHVIHVTPRFVAWRRGLRRATIDVDRESKVVRRLVLEREHPDYGRATVTFTLVDTRAIDEADYGPGGHLEEPYQLLTRATVPDRRRELLGNWFGAVADRWIVHGEGSADER